MSATSDEGHESERRLAAGRVATWFGGELTQLLELLRSTVAGAAEHGSPEADQTAATRILTAARGCSSRVSSVLGLRAEPPISASTNLGVALRAVLGDAPHVDTSRIAANGFDDIELPLSTTSLGAVLRQLLDNAVEASAEAPQLRAVAATATHRAELWVINRGSLSMAEASRAPCPFYTTKPHRRGLGLALVHIAAENQGGRLEILPGQEETRVGVVFPPPSETTTRGADSYVSFACHLAAGLAHDVNNALMAALGWAEILGDARDEEERQEALLTLAQAADYLEAMSYLLPYDGPRRADPLDLDLDLAQAFERMRPLLRAVLEHKADRKIALRVRSVPGARVTMSEHALRALVLRLAENARDAMPRGGTWTIACDVRAQDLLLTLSSEVRGTDLGTSPLQGPAAKPHGVRQAAFGLALARDLVAAAGGAFEDDPLGPPSSVRIRLPGPLT